MNDLFMSVENQNLQEQINQDLSAISSDNLKLIAEFVEFIKHKQENQQRLEELQQKIAIGAQEIEQGQIMDGELVFEELQNKLKNEYGL